MTILPAMACGSCNQYTPKPANPKTRQPKRLANGVYELYHHPGDSTPYNGRHRADAVYVCGIGTEGERIFRKADRGEAVRYAKANEISIDSFAVTQLCEVAMLEIFGS